MLDAEVELTGAVSGRFDGKMQVTGILLHANSLSAIKIDQTGRERSWDLPLTHMDEVLSAYHVQQPTQRVRVHGTITYYQPGSAVVLAGWLKEPLDHDRIAATPLRIGDQADATGFPDVHDGFLALTDGEIQDREISTPVTAPLRHVDRTGHEPSPLRSDLNRGAGRGRKPKRRAGRIRPESRRQPLLGHLPAPRQTKPATRSASAMKQIALGSKVRVTGICIMGASNPFDTQVPFDILMRTTDDIVAIGAPSWFNVGNLVRVVVRPSGDRADRRRMGLDPSHEGAASDRNHHRARRDRSARQERHNAQLEMKRSRILEDINSSRPMPELIDAITEMVAFSLDCPFCWCEMPDGARLGNAPANTKGLRSHSAGYSGARRWFAGNAVCRDRSWRARPHDEASALEAGVRLATLAIETRKLYKDLVYRSEFDLLTDIHNRFSLDRYLEQMIEKAKVEGSIFGLVYVDLDEFKQVNDFYGHHVGDLYLQEVSMRMKRQLRSGDMLARLGGDEFAALVPVVRSRAAIEEIAQRLERCFDAPFAVEGYVLRGGASVGVALYPDDGTSPDSLLSAADAAMYVAKHTKRHRTEMPDRLQQVALQTAKNKADKNAPIPNEPARVSPLVNCRLAFSAHVQLRDRHFAFDQIRLAPLALLVQSHPAAFLAAVVPILVELVVDQRAARLPSP